MKYRNSLVYVQRQIDIILRKYCHFIRIYVDDIVIFLNTLKKHSKHLTFIFALFKKYNIVIKTFKIYFDYFIIVLLNQRVNNFDLFIFENKLKIIFDLKFFIFQIFENLFWQNRIFTSIYNLLCAKNNCSTTTKNASVSRRAQQRTSA